MGGVASESRAACADRLDLVDAAFDRPGGDAGHLLREQFCPHCPIAEACLVAGMRGEDGVWGGTSRKQRTQHGAPPAWRNGQRQFRIKETA